MKIYYHQLNVCELDKEIENIKSISGGRNRILIGLEVTIPEISKKLTYNIDPQHHLRTWTEGKDSDITCIEKFRNFLPKVGEMNGKELHVFFLKPDLDSISAAAVLDIYLDNPTWILQEDISERIQAIAEYDRHGRDRRNFQCRQKIPRGLFMYIAGWKNSIHDKINITKTWILDGTFKDIYKFNRIADKKFKQSLFNSKAEIIIPKKLVFIKSINRGACGIGYKYAPVTIALNPSYRFGLDDSRIYGKKWIIAQQNNGFVNMSGILEELSRIEPGWGGSPSIIGSPQDRPSKVLKDDIIDIVAQKMLVF
jgi:hypothetical protein